MRKTKAALGQPLLPEPEASGRKQIIGAVGIPAGKARSRDCAVDCTSGMLIAPSSRPCRVLVALSLRGAPSVKLLRPPLRRSFRLVPFKQRMKRRIR